MRPMRELRGGDSPLEIVHTTHDDVRVDVFEEGDGGAAGGRGESSGGGGGGDEECPVCYDVVPGKVVAQSVCRHALRTCGHFVCDDCLFGHVRVRVMDEGDLALLVCPAEGCREAIASEGVERVLEQDPDAAARYRQLLSRATVTQNAAVSWCPAAGCEASLERPAHVHCRHVAVTCVCGTSFCFGCKAITLKRTYYRDYMF